MPENLSERCITAACFGAWWAKLAELENESKSADDPAKFTSERTQWRRSLRIELERAAEGSIRRVNAGFDSGMQPSFRMAARQGRSTVVLKGPEKELETLIANIERLVGKLPECAEAPADG